MSYLLVLIQFVNLFDDNYFDNSNEVRIVCVYIYIWFGDSFDNDDSLCFEMMKCICWVNYVKWGIWWVILILIDVVKWWILMMV